MTSRMSHAVIDHVNAAQDRLIAARLRRDRRALRIARQNLRRWMARDGRKVRPVFREWHGILVRLNAREIAAFLETQNRERQTIERAIADQAIDQAAQLGYDQPDCRGMVLASHYY